MTRLSTLQYNMLRMFFETHADHMSVLQAQTYKQTTFRSMLIQEWIEYRPGKGFHITRKGRAAYKDFVDHDISRKNTSLPLTAYFDPVAYGLDKKPQATSKKRSLHIVAA